MTNEEKDVLYAHYRVAAEAEKAHEYRNAITDMVLYRVGDIVQSIVGDVSPSMDKYIRAGVDEMLQALFEQIPGEMWGVAAAPALSERSARFEKAAALQAIVNASFVAPSMRAIFETLNLPSDPPEREGHE